MAIGLAKIPMLHRIAVGRNLESWWRCEAMSVHGQRVQFFYSSLDTTIFSAHITGAIVTLATHMFQINPKLR